MPLLSMMFFCLVMMGFLRILTRRRKAVFISTTCTGSLVGLLLVTKALSSDHCASTQCIQEFPAYQTLMKNEISIKVKHPLISSVDVNYLPSNSPNEDRYSLGAVAGSSLGLFAVIDGHKTSHCSEHLRHTLLPYVARALVGKAGVKGQLKPHRDGDQLMDAMDGSQGWEENAQLIEESLKSSFNELDKNISDEAMNCLKLIEKGRSIKEEGMLPIIMRAVAGACALVTMVTDATFYVASTGDCRAVLGTSQHGEWLATPLSVDQNVRNQDEVDRIKSNHPGEENTVIVGGRLLGMLMPFRSFGDVECKWPANMTKMINNLLLNYETPPYLTAEPVVTHWTHQSTNKFLILSTDGMWDKLTNEQAVNTVGKIVQDHASHQSTKSSIFSFFTQRRNDLSCCLKQNAATGLLWEALGGDPSAVQDMLDIPPSIRRSFRDDMTIIVVHFK